MAGYVELQISSNYSFLRGASRIEELVLQAKAFGYDTLAITDHNTLAGIARAHARAKERACAWWWVPGWICGTGCPC